MVADGVTTIVWQEPISALYTQQQQDRLRAELPTVVRRFAPLARGRVRLPSLAAEAVELGRTTPTRGPLGRITIPSLGVRFVMVQGADRASLELGPGHYTGTVLPGRPGTVGIAGHRTTYLAPFRHVDRLGRGARIVLHMPYGTFTYRVSGRRYVSPTDTSVLRARGGGQRLVLTTCDPLFSDARRLVVFAKLRSVRRT
jgi:sortase A